MKRYTLTLMKVSNGWVVINSGSSAINGKAVLVLEGDNLAEAIAAALVSGALDQTDEQTEARESNRAFRQAPWEDMQQLKPQHRVPLPPFSSGGPL